MKKKALTSLFTALLMLVMVLVPSKAFAFTDPADSGDCRLTYEVKCGQTASRQLTDKINAFRTSDDAWYWNESDTKRVCCNQATYDKYSEKGYAVTKASSKVFNKLKPMTYDYTIEEIAQYRAAESSIKMWYTRLNGEGNSAGFGAYKSAIREEIQIGGLYTNNAVDTPSNALSRIIASKDGYDGQDYRRALLNPEYNIAGAGHVIVNGYHYWIILVGEEDYLYYDVNSTKTAARDGVETFSFLAAQKEITKHKNFKSNASKISLYVDETVERPTSSIEVGTDFTAPDTSYVKVDAGCKYKIEDTSIAVIDGKKIKGIKQGKTNLIMTSNIKDYSVKVPIAVESKANDPAHNYVMQTKKEATCKEAGSITYYCDHCKDTYTESIPKKAHAYAISVNKKADFNTDGERLYKCSNCGYEKTEVIKKLGTPTLSCKQYTYNNTVKSPSVTVCDSDEKKIDASNYTVKYASGRKSIGTYKVTVTANSEKYQGTKTVSFKIVPFSKSISSITSGKGYMTVKWSAPNATYRSQITGYQIRYSKSKSMASAKTVTVKSRTATSKKIKSLSKKCKYYVQLRAYKTGDYYGSWSAIKTVTTK